MKRRRQRLISQLTNYVGSPNLSSLACCVGATPASPNEDLSDARHSNRSGPQAGEISPRTRRRRRLAPSARRLDYTGFDYTLHRIEGLEQKLARLKEELRQSREASSSDGHPRWRRQPRTLTTASTITMTVHSIDLARI